MRDLNLTKGENGYGTIKTPPEFSFGTVYEAKFEMTEESAKEFEKLMQESDKDALRFYDVFGNDLICCIYKKCEKCHLQLMKDNLMNCKLILEGNVRKMVQNQRRMYVKFMEKNYENDGK